MLANGGYEVKPRIIDDQYTLQPIIDAWKKEFFLRKNENIGKKEDLLLAFTTSGNSSNICEAINSAKKIQIPVVLVTGKDGGDASKLLSKNDIEIRVPSNRTSRIQEIHLIIIHSICECIDEHLC